MVTYKGTAALTNDLLGNHVPLGFNTIPASISNIAAGQLRGLAVATSVRSAALPDVPTAAESGLPGFEAVQYYGLAAPAGTPRPIIERLNKELRTILAADEMKKRLIAEGSDPHQARPKNTPPISARRGQVVGAGPEARAQDRVTGTTGNYGTRKSPLH